MQTYAGPGLAAHVVKPAVDAFNRAANGEMEIEVFHADELVSKRGEEARPRWPLFVGQGKTSMHKSALGTRPRGIPSLPLPQYEQPLKPGPVGFRDCLHSLAGGCWSSSFEAIEFRVSEDD